MAELWHTNSLSGMIMDYSFRSNHQGTGSGTGGGKGTKATEPQKNSATLFVGQIPDSGILDNLLPGSTETSLFAYDINFIDKKDKK